VQESQLQFRSASKQTRHRSRSLGSSTSILLAADAGAAAAAADPPASGTGRAALTPPSPPRRFSKGLTLKRRPGGSAEAATAILNQLFDRSISGASSAEFPYERVILTKTGRESSTILLMQRLKQLWPSLDVAILGEASPKLPQAEHNNEDKLPRIPARLIFGELLTSSHYNEKERQTTTGARNGLGVKLAAIYDSQAQELDASQPESTVAGSAAR
jgi:hypothetical protein